MPCWFWLALLLGVSGHATHVPHGATCLSGEACSVSGQSLLQRTLPTLHQNFITNTQSRPYILSFFDDKYVKYLGQWRNCTMKALGTTQYDTRVQMVNATAMKYNHTPSTNSLSLAQVTPNYLLLALPQLLRDGVAQNRNMMHVDVDAFLLRDPAVQFMDDYPGADIVASVDFAGEGYDAYYKTPQYLARHGGVDPIGMRGFMLNMGVILFRGNTRVRDMLDELIAARRSVGSTFGDQTLFNEVLLEWNCTWTMNDGDPLPQGVHVRPFLLNSTLQGACVGDRAHHTGVQLGRLNLVVFPFTVVTRYTDLRHIGADTVAFHPGSNKVSNKSAGLELAASLCA